MAQRLLQKKKKVASNSLSEWKICFRGKCSSPARPLNQHLTVKRQTFNLKQGKPSFSFCETLQFILAMSLSEWTPRAILTALFLGPTMGFQTICVVFAEFLAFVIWPFTAKWTIIYLAHLMELWSQHLVFMIQYFAPSDFVITADESCTAWSKSDGSSTDIGIEEMIRRKNDGTIDTLAFPPRLLFIANHQVPSWKIGTWGKLRI